MTEVKCELLAALEDAYYKISCLCERFDFEDGAFNSGEPCAEEELCGHWACDECGCIKDARDNAREALRHAKAEGASS